MRKVAEWQKVDLRFTASCSEVCKDICQNIVYFRAKRDDTASLEQLNFVITTTELYVEHPVVLNLRLLNGDEIINGGALQPQRVGSAVQYHHHLITRTEHLVPVVSLLEQVGLYDGGGG